MTMKSTKMIALATLFLAGLTFTSCKKCATCKYDKDGETGEIEEFCQKSRAMKDSVKELEDAGWVCTYK